MKLNKEGFYRPVVDTDKCIQCGLCEKICPWNHEIKNPNTADVHPATLAAYAKDDFIRMHSSSGGIFSVLAEKILEEKGIVIGVTQLSKNHFGHIIVKSKEELSKLRGSKYVQADVGFIYRRVRDLLKSNCKVLFSGTPCQVAGLYSVLGKHANSTKLFTVDIVCHGVPSVKVFGKYIEEIEKDRSASVVSTHFREKQNGWRLYSITSSLKSDSGNSFQVSETLHKNKFLQLFLHNICLNTSCADCHYSKFPRIADISLGDYWGIEKHHSQMNDDKGSSVVLLNTLQGKELLDSIKDKIVWCESKIEWAIAENPSIASSSQPHPNRTEFFEDLGDKSLNQLIKKYRIDAPATKNLWNFLHLPDTRIRERIFKLYANLKQKFLQK